MLVWSPLAGGMLSGKYSRNQPTPEGTRHLANWGEPPVRDQEKVFDIVDVLVDIAHSRGISAAQIALAWLLARPTITSVVIGKQRTAQRQSACGQPDPERRIVATIRGREPSTADLPLLGIRFSTAPDRLCAADRFLIAPHLSKK